MQVGQKDVLSNHVILGHPWHHIHWLPYSIMIPADDHVPNRYQAFGNHYAESTMAMMSYELYYATNTSNCGHELTISLEMLVSDLMV